MSFRIFLIIYVLSPFLLSAQGKFLLVGGGSEKDTPSGWSNMPYSWAVNQADNKSVAILSYSESSDPGWLPAYFLKLGAAAATNFVIENREQAEDLVINNAISEYDFVFIKGGDQSEYYELYNDTRLELTIREIFDRGGVIGGTSAGMAILSTPFFSAEKGSFYPDQALGEIRSDRITLRTDMFGFNPGFIFDTHFIERGRHARLMSLIANADSIDGIPPAGIGIDDQTALCIDETGNAVVYGTGAVAVLRLEEFGTDGQKPAGRSKLLHLVHGDAIDLNTFETTAGYTLVSEPEPYEGSGRYDVYLAGSREPEVNVDWMIASLSSGDQVSLIAPEGSSLAQEYHQDISSAMFQSRIIPVSEMDSCDRAEDINYLTDSDAIIWVDNDWEDLSAFLDHDPAGKRLNEMKQKNGLKHFLIGDNADFAGGTFAPNREQDRDNAYYGDLEFVNGLSLTDDFMIVQNAYDPSTTVYYENNTASVLYGIISYSHRYGLWLNERSFARIHSNGDARILEISGDYSALLAVNNGTQGKPASQPVNEAGNVRQVMGFNSLELKMISGYPEVLSGVQENFLPDLPYAPEPVSSVAYTITDQGLNIEWVYEGIPLPLMFKIYYSRATEDNRLVTVNGEERSATIENWEPGNYLVTAVSDNGESCPAVIQADGVTFLEDDQIPATIFPNPVTDGYLSISGGNTGKLISVAIYNMDGRLIHEVKNASEQIIIDVSNLPNGIYLAEFQMEGKLARQKIIIARGAD